MNEQHVERGLLPESSLGAVAAVSWRAERKEGGNLLSPQFTRPVLVLVFYNHVPTEAIGSPLMMLHGSSWK
jgi:hypothetical protein